jgi:hypothetical protein
MAVPPRRSERVETNRLLRSSFVDCKKIGRVAAIAAVMTPIVTFLDKVVLLVVHVTILLH